MMLGNSSQKFRFQLGKINEYGNEKENRNMVKVLLWDIDGTLLNFEAAEKQAIRDCFKQFNMGICDDAMLARYSRINRTYWERLERGELTKPEVLRGRFIEFFGQEHLPVENADPFNAAYQIGLGNTVVFQDNGYELVKSFKSQFKQYAATNGTYVAQERKLKKSGLDQLLDGAFISDQIGSEKPTLGFFDAVWQTIGTYQKEEVMIIGDSLTSDIQGANNAGIQCCWYNPGKKQSDHNLQIDYEIQNLQDLKRILL